MRIDLDIVTRAFQRWTSLGQPPRPIEMADGNFTAIDIEGGPGGGSALRSDGHILTWGLPDVDDNGDYRVETDERHCLISLVEGAARTPELLEALPPRPVLAVDCPNCQGFGRISLGGAPRYLICHECSGLGWVLE